MPPVVLQNPQGLKEFVGREIGVSEWFVISQGRIAQFAEATEDRQWIHLDRTRAKAESPYGTTIAHGFLTLSLLSHFLQEAVDIQGGVRFAVNYGLDRVRFPAPLAADAKVRARISLVGLKEREGSVEATYSVTVESDGLAKPHCVAEWIIRYYS
jgi:acyl dehydratase